MGSVKAESPENTVPAETHVEGEPMERDDVLTLVKDCLAEIPRIEPSEINEGDAFAEDLDADLPSALIELVEAIEEELAERTTGFRIEDEDPEDLRTVRDAVDYVVAKADPLFSAPSTTLEERLGYHR